MLKLPYDWYTNQKSPKALFVNENVHCRSIQQFGLALRKTSLSPNVKTWRQPKRRLCLCCSELSDNNRSTNQFLKENVLEIPTTHFPPLPLNRMKTRIRARASPLCLSQSCFSQAMRDNSQHRSAKNSWVEETSRSTSGGDRFSGRSVLVTRSGRTATIRHYSPNSTNRVTRTFHHWRGFRIFGTSERPQCFVTAIKIISIGGKGCWYLHWYKYCCVCSIYQEFSFYIKVSYFKFASWILPTHGRNQNWGTFKHWMPKTL